MTREATKELSRRRFSVIFKLKILKFLQNNSSRSTASEFEIYVKQIRDWRRNKIPCCMSEGDDDDNRLNEDV